MDEARFSAFPIVSVERSTRRSKAGRICNDPSCETRLSIYNDGKFCSLHAPMITPRTRGRKIPA